MIDEITSGEDRAHRSAQLLEKTASFSEGKRERPHRVVVALAAFDWKVVFAWGYPAGYVVPAGLVEAKTHVLIEDVVLEGESMCGIAGYSFSNRTPG